MVAFRCVAIAFALLAVASPASAQWTQVPEVPAADVFSLSVKGDTIAAGTDTSVYLSTDAGATWRGSSRVAAGVTSIQAVLVRNGRLYAGTFGQGVFVSDDLGASWQGYNEGLVGGFLDSQLDLSDLQVLGDHLYAGTLGAGVYVRSLSGAGAWSHFGEVFEPNQASNVNAVVPGGTRLIALGGDNGQVFFRDPGDLEWTISSLDNVGLHPGVEGKQVIWNGAVWVVGTSVGLFRSALGQEPWTFSSPGLGALFFTSFATAGRQIFVAFDIVNAAVIAHSDDDAVTWQLMEVLPGAFVYRLARSGSDLYAARADGLWRRPSASLAVPARDAAPALSFALAGPQPARDQVRFRFALPDAGEAVIDVFDVSGRRAASPIREIWPAGEHEVTWDAHGLPPGVYQARLVAGGRQAMTRVIRVR